MEYTELINAMYKRADAIGKLIPDEAWLMIDHVWWPNPYYTGEPIVHPEDPNGNEYNPEK